MTKHPHEELASKCPVDLDGAIKLRSEAAGLIEKNDLAFCDMDSAFAKTDIAAIGVKVHVDRCELAKVLSKLYDLEDYICLLYTSDAADER
ncbi:MAG: hypothetical protein N3E52_07015, partial [Candidatus Bathyarchaeota archaeon]|nr:hypothetical protein [Candidatus Bathyarchaeota archaeon]